MANPEALALLKIARRDLTAAALLQDPSADEANWGFQIQQAIEKALKAWLLGLGDDPPFIHNLTALFGRLTDRGVVLVYSSWSSARSAACSWVLPRSR